MIAVLVALLAMGQAAQPAQPARALITVVDQMGGVIPNAKVTIGNAAAVLTNDKGVATVIGLTPGKLSITAEFPGFETRTLKDMTFKAGENKHVVVLPIQGLQDSVTVSRDAREAASDRRSTFGTAMTREQIEALSDDPDEMAQQLQDIAGGNAVIRVDSFEGSRLPPKSSIKAIHITRDAFAAENHFAGGLFIDIITAPGMGPLRTNMNMSLRDGSMSGKPPVEFADQQAKGPEQIQRYGGGLSGSLIKNKASFSINVNGGTSYDTPYFYYYTPDGILVNDLAPRRPRDNMYVFGQFDYAISRDQTLRVYYSEDRSTTKSGAGGWDLLERGYSSEDRNHSVRIQEAGPLGRRFFINTRAMINLARSDSHSLFEQPTVRVIDGFTSGGQQRRGGGRSNTVNLQSDLDYVRGIHSWRTGLTLDGGSFRSNDASNYLGTYTFESLANYRLGLPRSYTLRIGDPNIQYNNVQAGWYLQDDIRVRKNLTLSPGIRYEAQTHLSDYNNFGPRFGVTWSPGKDGKTTLRGSAGIFYDWLQSSIYEQTLRVDGQRQREINVDAPSFPVPPDPALGASAPTNKYLLGGGLEMQQNFRVSAGVSRTISKMLSVNANYAYTRGENLMRGLNLNGPVDDVRPDPTLANVVEVTGDASSRQNTLNIGASVNFNTGGSGPGGPMMMGPGIMIMAGGGEPPPPPPPGTRPTPANARWNWRRMSLFTNVFLGRVENNTDGAFSLPATGRIEDDWGPSNGDVRSRFNIGWSSQQLRNLNMNVNVNASTAPPYTIRTGFDTNRDLLYTDRPEGIGRNTERGSGQWTVNGNFSYGWTFGKPVERAGGVMLRGDAGGISASQGSATTAGRFRLSLNANIQNLTNHHNLIGYTGTITSRNFRQATGFSGTRKFDFGLGLSF